MASEPTIQGLRQMNGQPSRLPSVRVVKVYPPEQKEGRKGAYFNQGMDVTDGSETIRAYVMYSYANQAPAPNTLITINKAILKISSKGNQFVSGWLDTNGTAVPDARQQARVAQDEIDNHFQHTPIPQPGPVSTSPTMQDVRQAVRGNGYGKSPEESARICRQNALTAAVTLYAAGDDPRWDESDVLRTAATFAHWTFSGQMPAAEPQMAQPEPMGNPNTVPNEDIPF